MSSSSAKWLSLLLLSASAAWAAAASPSNPTGVGRPLGNAPKKSMPAAEPIREPARLSSERPVVPFEVFFQDLRAYGSWVQIGESRKPLWAWKPTRVASDWRPFTRGTWILTAADHATTAGVASAEARTGRCVWYWLSEEPWGWATSHYGRWEYRQSPAANPQSAVRGSTDLAKVTPQSSWLWIPGPDWSPATVQWRQGDVGLMWSSVQTAPDAPSASENPPLKAGAGWNVLLWRDMAAALLPRAGQAAGGRTSGSLEAIAVSSAPLATATAEILSQTQPIAGKDFAAPDPTLVEAKTGRRLAPCRILNSSRPRELLLISRDETMVVVFRPLVRENSEAIQKSLSERADRYRKMQEKRKPAK